MKNSCLLFIFGLMIFLSGDVLALGGAVSGTGFDGPTNNFQAYAPTFNRLYSGQVESYWPIINDLRNDQCEAVSDFVVAIPPGGCSPSVVRSDLLEEQNVPVFCQLYSVKTNPLIKVSSIRSISFKGKYPEGVSSISFHPARAAARSYRSLTGDPLINNIGYVVIILKRNRVEGGMEDWIAGNLTATIRYDAEKAFGVGKSEYYLPVIGDDEWDEDYERSSFWKGRGYLRAEEVDGDGAKIQILTSKDRVINLVNLNVGETSQLLYLPGYYCRAGMRVKLNNVVSSEDSALLSIDGREIWVRAGSRILNGQCQVRGLRVNKDGSGDVKISCAGAGTFDLKLSRNNETKKDKVLSAEGEEYFRLAEESVNELVETFGAVKNEREVTFGEESLIRQISLAEFAGKFETHVELMELFLKEYPSSSQADWVRAELNRAGNFSYAKAFKNVFVANKFHNIGISSLKSVSAMEKKASFKVGSKQISDVFEGHNESIWDGKLTVKRILPGKVEFSFSPDKEGIRTSSAIISQGEFGSLGRGDIYVQRVDVEEVAYVSLIPEIKQTRTDAEFTFKVGIEKRNIKLSTEKSEEMLENVESSIERWENINGKLGKLVKGWKGACFATSAFLMVKNVLSGFDGTSLARRKVMKNYRVKCSESQYKAMSRTECYNNLSSQIDKDVEVMAKAMSSVNKEMDSVIESNKVSGGFLSEGTVVNQEKYVEDLKEKLDDGWEVEVNGQPIKREDLETSSQVRAALLAEELKGQGVSGEVAKLELEESLKNLAARKEKEGNKSDSQNSSRGECSYPWRRGTAEVRYYESGRDKGNPAIVPFDLENGFYAMVPNSRGTFLEDSPKGYTGAGVAKYFKICSVGPNGLMEMGTPDDFCASFSDNSADSVSKFVSCPSMKPTEVRTLYRKASDAIRQAAAQYGEGKKISVFDKTVNVGAPLAELGGLECQDFMSPDECKLMFNICDPVICPSSRCDMGGKNPVGDVIATGVVGSILQCLPNSREGIYVPICVSGVHAGLDAYTSILKSERDCLKKSIETGEIVGICDEITSIYKCEFFWKQASPVMNLLIPKLFTSLSGSSQGVRGGGEYLLVQNAWDNLERSIGYFKDNYAQNAFRAFNLRNIEEAGSTFCRSFIGTSLPTSADAIDSLLEPESPPQFYAKFSENLFSEATVPATSQYKVYYHIYAGKDKGVQFRVYLKNSPSSGYYAANPRINVKTGYIAKGTSADEAIDFTAPEGYKELCVVIDAREECGFKQVTSDFGLDYLSGKFVEEQASTTDITTEKECISGSPSLLPMAQFNLQSGVEESLNPDISLRGIVRVCANENPSAKLNSSRWKDVGYCGEQNFRCWLDLDSVKGDLKKIAAIENLSIKNLDEIKEIIATNERSHEEAKDILVKAREKMKNFRLGGLNEIIWMLDNVTGSMERDILPRGDNRDIAEAWELKANVYDMALRKILVDGTNKGEGSRLEADIDLDKEDLTEEAEKNEFIKFTSLSELGVGDYVKGRLGDSFKINSIKDNGDGNISLLLFNYVSKERKVEKCWWDSFLKDCGEGYKFFECSKEVKERLKSEFIPTKIDGLLSKCSLID